MAILTKGIHPDIRAMARAAEKQGCTVRKTRSGHLLVRGNGGTVTLPATPGGPRSLLNARADLRRELGIDI